MNPDTLATNTSPDVVFQSLLGTVNSLAREAGRRIMLIYESDFAVTEKPDQSPLTQADLASHDCLQAGLSALSPSWPVISEESADIPFIERSTYQTYWLIDPLDGTKEFIKRNGEFTVNVALIHRHRPVLGVVYAPVLDLCYFAAMGCGAFRQTGTGVPVPISVATPALKPPRLVGSRSHGSSSLDAFIEKIGPHEWRAIGSSLKFCRVAEGSADLYPRFGPTSEWDTAAAQCVVEAAGGAVVDLSGQAIAYNLKPSILNPSFLVFGDSGFCWPALAAGCCE